MTQKIDRRWFWGTHLATGVKVIALINLLYSFGLIIAEVFLYLQNGLQGLVELNPEFSNTNIDSSVQQISKQKRTIDLIESSAKDHFDRDTKTVLSVPLLQFIVSLIWIMTWVISILLSILLYRAAVIRNWRFAVFWFYYRIVALIFRMIFLAIYVVAGYSILPKIPVLVQFLIGIYSIWLVNSFIHELKEEEQEKLNQESELQNNTKVNSKAIFKPQISEPSESAN